LSAQGYVVINTTRSLAELGLGEYLAKLPPGHAVTVPATELALRHIGRPVPNVALLAALLAESKILRLESLEAAVKQKFKGQVAEQNIAAAREAFALCARGVQEGAAARC
jgi:pyruvate ferredoxin oxidoreductase gamma subunit